MKMAVWQGAVQGENNKSSLQYLQTTCSTALTCISGHGSQKFFFTGLFGEAKKGAGVLHQALLPVSQKDGGDSPPHRAVPGLTWEFILFLTSSYVRKRTGSKKAPQLSALFTLCSFLGHFPARQKRKLPGHKAGALGTVSLSHVNPL